MKVLLSSVPFAPLVGGIETVGAILATELSKLGCDVTVLTKTRSPTRDEAPYHIVRDPSTRAMFGLAKAADVILHNSISLKAMWPLSLSGKPAVVIHHTWLPKTGYRIFARWAKQATYGSASHVAISSAIADDLGLPSTIIPNPYDDGLFRNLGALERNRDIAFVGRLVSDKGVNVLIDALALLHARGFSPTVTVVGTGDEEDALHEQAKRLGVADQIEFRGLVTGQKLVELLNRHVFLAIPSTWEEPFGIVALEGIACGCIPLAAKSGGLPEAIGGCGVLFQKGNAADLADHIERLFADPSKCAALRSRAESHLLRHTQSAVAKAYLRVLEEAVREPSALARSTGKS
jgi:glycosyltransferase involved in cell wall biosynthesis